MIRYILFLIIIVAFNSCNSTLDTFPVKMQDGMTISVNSSIKYYPDEESFVHDVSFSVPRQYEYFNVEKFEYVEDSTYVAEGHDQSFIGYWEKATFGDWIKEYGLVPQTVYYVATKIYTKNITMPQDGLEIVPKWGSPLMGYCPNTEYTTFKVNNNKEQHVSTLYTGVKYIGYDSKGKGIYKEIPSLNINQKITWKFLIQNDGWE